MKMMKMMKKMKMMKMMKIKIKIKKAFKELEQLFLTNKVSYIKQNEKLSSILAANRKYNLNNEDESP